MAVWRGDESTSVRPAWARVPVKICDVRGHDSTDISYAEVGEALKWYSWRGPAAQVTIIESPEPVIAHAGRHRRY